MSRQSVHFEDGRLLVLGWDPPFGTWFATLHPDGDPDSPPTVAIGYHPAEQGILQAERPDAVIGPYPVDDAEQLLTVLIPQLMGIEPENPQPPCWACGQPPWQSNPDCPRHTYDRLRES